VVADAGVELRRALDAIADARTIEVASALAAIPAPLGEEGPLAEAVASFLDRPGIDVHLQAVVPGRPNVIATVRGTESGAAPALVLNAHLDAAWAPGGRRDPYRAEIEGNRLYAGGITDMKGPLAAMIVALEAAASRGGLRGDLVLHAVIAHNPTGLGTKYAVATEPVREPGAAYAIVGQGSNLELHTENSGAVKFEIELAGRAAHVSFQEEGVDALAAANRVYDALAGPAGGYGFAFTHQPIDRLPGFPKFVVGELIAGGRAQIPALLPGSGLADRAVLRGDVRTVPGQDRHTVAADLQRAVAGAAPGVVASRVRIISDVHPFIGRRDSALIAALSAAHETVRGAPPALATNPRQRGFVTDAPVYEERGIASVVYGPGPWRYEPDEYIELDELLDAARIYFATALLLGKSSGG
jgi:acetylornithine deacetylase/succinyl-diaminopimelate desuccinylase-like protein